MLFDTKGHSFERDIVMLNVRWYLSYKLSYRDLEEMAAERGLEVDHTTIYGSVAFANSEREIGLIRKHSCSNGIENLCGSFTLRFHLPFSNYSHHFKATNCNLCSSKFLEAQGCPA